MKSKSELKRQYEAVCNEYIARFVRKQGYEFSFWVGDIVGGIACFVEQYYFNLQDIVWDINSNQPKDLIFEHQDGILDGTIDSNVTYFMYCKEKGNEKEK